MRIVVTTDELYPVNQFVVDWLKNQGHQVILCGALKSQQDEPWVKSAAEACQMIVENKAEEGIFFCWSGTGISIAANKFKNIRAALCFDAETARAARIWNHANVLALSNRQLSQDIAKEILTAWFDNYDKTKGAGGVKDLQELEINC